MFAITRVSKTLVPGNICQKQTISRICSSNFESIAYSERDRDSSSVEKASWPNFIFDLLRSSKLGSRTWLRDARMTRARMKAFWRWFDLDLRLFDFQTHAQNQNTRGSSVEWNLSFFIFFFCSFSSTLFGKAGKFVLLVDAKLETGHSC